MKHLHRELTFAGLQAFDPRVTEICVSGISTFAEPRSTGCTTTFFAGFLNDTALGTGWDHSR